MTEGLIPVRFFRSDSGREPVREWLRCFDRRRRKQIGEDLKTVQIAWPTGMPLVRKLDSELWEVRSRIDGDVARVLFTVELGVIVLLHGFIKKSQRTPRSVIAVAKRRLQQLRSSR